MKNISMKNILKISNLDLIYTINNSQIKVLQDLNFEINDNETVSLVGTSGSGKTSLLMLIAGLEKPSKGKIFFLNHEITKLNEDEISKIRKSKIGIIFQSFYLLPNYNVLENVSITLEINHIKKPKEKAKLLLDKLGLGKRLYNFPSQLSGGEQQRVAIARSVAMRPRLILADEPTGNLDSYNSKIIIDLLFDYVKEEKSTLILVTHDKKLAKRSKKCIEIKDGKIIRRF